MNHTLPLQLKRDDFSFIKVKGKNPSISGDGWQNQRHSYKEAEEWLEKGYNYGVMGGCGGVIILDADTEAIDTIAETLPETFTVQTGSGKRHFYFICPEIDKKVVFNDAITPSRFTKKELEEAKKKDKKPHYGEIISQGTQVVGPGSIHPDTGKLYKVQKNLPIAEISREVIFSALSDFISIPVELPEYTQVPPDQQSDIDKIKIQSIINVPKTCNIIHPIHGATNGGNLNIDVEKNCWHCFRCGSGGGPLQLIAVLEGLIQCDESRRGVLRGDLFLKTRELAEKKYHVLENPYASLSHPKTFSDETTKINPPEEKKSMRFSELITAEFPDAEYIVEPMFESNSINMISAPPNNWKSWLLLLFSEKISKGETIMDQFNTEKSNVMIINEEDTYKIIQNRFKILNIKDPSLPIFFRIAQGTKMEPEFIDGILEEAKKEKIKLVIFDSLRAVHSADENSSKEMQLVMEQFKRFTRENITVLFTHHHRKSNFMSKGDDSESSRGSSAINAAISGHISLREDVRTDGTFIVVKHLKSKAGEKMQPFEIKIEKERKDDKVTSINFVYAGDEKSSDKKINETKSKIMYVFSSEPTIWKTAKDFLTLAGRNTVRSALKLLTDEGLIESMYRNEAEGKRILLDSEGPKNEILYKMKDDSDSLESLF